MSSTKKQQPITVSSPNERCPHCDRQFGPKAFDRHVEWCKEHRTRIQKSPANVQLAKERLEARTKYKVPPLSKTKKITVKEKYSSNSINRTESVCSVKSSPPANHLQRAPSVRKPRSVLDIGKQKETPRKVGKANSIVTMETKPKEPSKSFRTKKCPPLHQKTNSPQINNNLDSMTVAPVKLVGFPQKKLVTWKEISGTIPEEEAKNDVIVVYENYNVKSDYSLTTNSSENDKFLEGIEEILTQSPRIKPEVKYTQKASEFPRNSGSQLVFSDLSDDFKSDDEFVKNINSCISEETLTNSDVNIAKKMGELKIDDTTISGNNSNENFLNNMKSQLDQFSSVSSISVKLDEEIEKDLPTATKIEERKPDTAREKSADEGRSFMNRIKITLEGFCSMYSSSSPQPSSPRQIAKISEESEEDPRSSDNVTFNFNEYLSKIDPSIPPDFKEKVEVESSTNLSDSEDNYTEETQQKSPKKSSPLQYYKKPPKKLVMQSFNLSDIEDVPPQQVAKSPPEEDLRFSDDDGPRDLLFKSEEEIRQKLIEAKGSETSCSSNSEQPVSSDGSAWMNFDLSNNKFVFDDRGSSNKGLTSVSSSKLSVHSRHSSRKSGGRSGSFKGVKEAASCLDFANYFDKENDYEVPKKRRKLGSPLPVQGDNSKIGTEALKSENIANTTSFLPKISVKKSLKVNKYQKKRSPMKLPPVVPKTQKDDNILSEKTKKNSQIPIKKDTMGVFFCYSTKQKDPKSVSGKEADKTKKNHLFEPTPKPVFKSKEDVSEYFSGPKSKVSSSKEGEKKISELDEEVIDLTVKSGELFSVDDAMYEEYKIYEEMYLKEKEQNVNSNKKKSKNSIKSYGIPLVVSGEEPTQPTKLSNDSAYGSLNRSTPKMKTPKLSPLQRKRMDSASSSGSEKVSPIPGKQQQQQQRISKFCHECGNRYPLATAKFCVECGVRRLVL